MRNCGSRDGHESRIGEGVDERGVEGMHVDDDVVEVRKPQTVDDVSLSMIESRRVEDEDMRVDRDSGATILVGS